MKKLLFIFSIFLLITCKKEAKNSIKPNFIIGNWIRLNDKPNQKTFEQWNSNFTGIGFTLQETDTIFKEKLVIIAKNDSLFLQVAGVNEHPTLFAFTSLTDSSFVCENPKNKFPKKITYSLNHKQLKATVSNDEFSIEFVFEKSN